MPGALALVLALLLFPVAAAAQDPSMTRFAAESTAVLHGVCIHNAARWDGQRRMIVTDTTIRAVEYLKGNLGSTITVSEPGGELPERNLAMTVPHVARFQRGEEVVVFVWRDPGGAYRVVGGAQGKYTVDRDPATGTKRVGQLPLATVIENLRAAGRGTP